LRVVSWVRAAQVDSFQGSRAPSDLWVTVEPYLQKFCQAYVKSYGENLERLTLRLEQRLGLPPASSKTKFLQIRLSRPTRDVIFRPCMDPATSTTNCSVGPPSHTDHQYQDWVFRQYYFSYGYARPSPFPWTTLGYTFDWSPRVHATGEFEFQKFGESEFVIPKGAPIEVLRVVDTAEYCKPN
jgi:hypothetical protein